MRTLLVTLIVIVFAFAACASPQAPPAKRYTFQGTIKAIDTKGKTATIDAGNIGDWMAAMTMDYPIKPDAELAKIKVGDKIQAVCVVSDNGYYVTDIKVEPAKK